MEANLLKQNTKKRIVYHLFIGLFAFCMVYPILWMISASFKENSDIFQNAASLWPKKIVIENYITGWKGFGGISFGIFLKNSLIITILTTLGSVCSSVLVAYGFARINFKFKKFWFSCMMLTMMLPVQVIMIPQYIFFDKLKLNNTIAPLVLPQFFGRVFFIFLIMQFISGIPKELDEAAYMDGCSRYGVFFRVILPLIVPAIITSTVFSFMWVWEDFFSPLLYLNTPAKYTIPLALRMYNDTSSASDWGATMAMSCVSLIPVFILFAFFQKYLVEGISTTGLKG
jgi:multiple sugar transport system permease protein